jgi:hypothetical protein
VSVSACQIPQSTRARFRVQVSCYGLSVKRVPKAHVRKAWYPVRGTVLGDDGNFGRWDLAGGSGSLWVHLESCVLSPALSYLLSASQSPWHKQSVLLHDLVAMMLASPLASSNGVSGPWTETSETMSQNKPFLFIVPLRYLSQKLKTKIRPKGNRSTWLSVDDCWGQKPLVTVQNDDLHCGQQKRSL